jgi:UDP-N-acetylmuramoylalanine--D-glutamate ligase
MLELKNKRVTVAGLGYFGGQIAAARWLVEQGAKVTVTDIAAREKLEASIKQLDGLPIEYHLGGHDERDFTSCDLVVASPAIAPGNAFLAAAAGAGVPITTEIRLFIERCPLPVIGVSGTKGKSTTTALLGLMLRTQYHVWQGGNIGNSLLFDLPRMEPGQLVLLELSSFMLHYLDQAQWSPHVAVLTMLAADHTEWHKTQEAYLEAKRVMVKYQHEDDIAVLEQGGETARRFAEGAKGTVLWYSENSGPRFELTIPGRHNQLNAKAAFTAASAVGVRFEAAQQAVRTFPGLPHRLQLVHSKHGVRYFDDSIGTIPTAAAAALKSFDRGTVIQILGGHDKNLPLEELCHACAEHAKAVLCIGETGPKIMQQLLALHPEFKPYVFECGTLGEAMRQAEMIAEEGDVVLLSPGCSSYDQFVNFQQRGDLFAQLARGC